MYNQTKRMMAIGGFLSYLKHRSIGTNIPKTS